MKETSLQWCPTKEMVAAIWAKPLQGSHFRKLRDYIMGRVGCVKPKGDAFSISKMVRKKVAKKCKVSGLHQSAKGDIRGHTRILQQ